MNCEFCNKTFSTKGNLAVHQKTAKFCLALRNIQVEENKKDYICEYCKKNLSRKDALKRHFNTCKFKILEEIKLEKDFIKSEKELLEKENNLLREEKKELQIKNEELFNERLEDLKEVNKQLIEASKAPKIVNKRVENKLLLNLAPSDILSNPEKVQQIFKEKFKENHLFKGIEGLAQFSIQHLLKNPEGKLSYICTDPSRKTFIYRNQDGDLYKDLECQQLINLIHQPAINRSQRIYDNIEYTYDDLVCEYEESLESEEVQNHLQEIEERKKTIEIQKEKKNHFYTKNYEIQNLPENKGKFIKSISVPLHNTLQ